MSNDDIKKQAEEISEEIIQKLGNFLRYELSCWPKPDNLAEMKRIIKSIAVRHLYKDATDAKKKE
jgi:hypothetical protein